MLFSIITIAKNNRAGLACTANSLQNQSFTDYEWIIVDGASADGTAEDLPAYNAHVISEPDHGIYDAMNKGLARAQGDYVVFMNAGDRFADLETLSVLAKSIQTTQADFIYGDAWEKSKGHKFYKSAHPLKYLIWGMPTHHQAMVYKRGALDTLPFNTNYKIAADYDFTCRFLQRAQKTHYIRMPLCVFAAGGVSQQNAAQARLENYRIRQSLGLVSPPVNSMVFILNGVFWRLRHMMPVFYQALRSVNNRLRAPAQNQTPHARPAIRPE